MKMTPGPKAERKLISGGSGARLKGGRVPQSRRSDMRRALIDAVNRAVRQGSEKTL